MPSLKDLKTKLESIREQIPAILLEVATSVALTGKALAERTIKDKGFGAEYSNNKVPAWFLTGKELNASGSAFVAKKLKGKTKEDQLANWKEFRDAQGLQTGYVDLSYANEMWAGMFPRDAYQEGDIFKAPLAHNNREGQNKMNWNRDRYGDFVGKVLSGDNFNAMGEVAKEEFVRLAFERNNL